MRAKEFLYENEGTKLTPEQLKAAIENNQAPKVVDASWSRYDNSFGDLVSMGFMTKESDPISGSDFLVTQTYTGPGPVTLVHSDGREEVINNGWKSETEVDYS